MYRRIEVEIDPAKLLGVYKDSPGIVSYRDVDGEIYYQRIASTEEALAEARHREIIGYLQQIRQMQLSNPLAATFLRDTL